MSDDFWEDPERVERFADREPDHRLQRLVPAYDDPAAVRVLDLGCAGGRNTVFLAERGFDVWALDAAGAMVERTRARVAERLGRAEAERRVVRGRMDDLSRWPDGAFELIVALGIHHAAESWSEWQRAASETARVLAPGGLLLLNQFTPEVDLTGDGVEPVPGEPHVYTGFPSGRAVLLDADALDREWQRRGLDPVEPSETKHVELDDGTRRVSVNALYGRFEI
ncbi:MAG: class I SAM-dependent methyltransferase [Longimicrobiales bacterium]|nr:class I SAM-dependent methyltransferase [Longimicrobiales bacterium]